MIKMVKGTYGLKKGREVEAMTPLSPAFTLPESREAELVAAGVAVKVEVPAQTAEDYDKMKMADLRKAAAALGVDASAAKTKQDVIAMIEAAQAPAEAEAEPADTEV